VFQPATQQDVGDCGVACLVMITGLTYAQVLDAFGKRSRKRVTAVGVTRHQLMRAARKLGCPLRFRKTEDVGREVGVIDLQRVGSKPGEDEHLAIVANGCLYNPAEGMLWADIEAFCRTRNWKILGIYVRRETKTE
jgi:hypothetical protein